MIVDASKVPVEKSIIVDTGTGQRIPFVYWANFETGEYKAFAPAPNGIDILAEPDCVTPIRVQGRAKGTLKAIPLRNGKALLPVPEPKKTPCVKSQIKAYGEMYRKVWRMRGRGRKEVEEKWQEFCANDPFLDGLVLKGISVRVSDV